MDEKLTTKNSLLNTNGTGMGLAKHEKIPTAIFSESKDAIKAVASEIADLIREKAEKNKNCVLGLATGSSPKGLYGELVRMHEREGLSFQNVVSFNLDEYYPMDPNSLQSYVRFMREHLFDHVDILPENIHIPDGTLPRDELETYCRDYENQIKDLGGLDLQILGIGRTGHVGFNEPGSGSKSRTRLATLDELTRIDAASDFFGEENVPRRAITMGVGTIMSSKRIILMAWGEGKAEIIKRTIEGDVTESIPATFLQNHPDTTIVLDEAAAHELVRRRTPWLVSECKWDEKLIRKAVTWLSLYLKKPVLKLTDRDYADHGMSDLLTVRGHAYSINLDIFNKLQRTITGWPGGKPNVDDTHRPERARPAKKKVIIFSPHPDDDVISMGGTFSRLAEHGHEVHVAYQTSGNIAVFDEDVIRYSDLFREVANATGLNEAKGDEFYARVTRSISNKQPGDIDSPEVMKIKGLIRRSESKAACRYFGVPENRIHFLDMPFYETGLIRKSPLSEDDIKIIVALLSEVQPHQIFAAGDLSDPHGTHRVCLEAIISAVERIASEKWFADCWIWLYRGAWQEWDINEIDMAVPLSPDELMRKRKAIFKHQSQKDTALFPGTDRREFWQRTEDRNRHTAEVYDMLGLPEYEGIEAFKRYRLEA